MKLEAVVLDLIRHGVSRCGAGFGNYPAGIRHAVGELLPLVDQAYHEKNGYGEPGKSIAESLAVFDERLKQ